MMIVRSPAPTLHIVLYHSNERDVKTILKLVGLRRSAKSTCHEHCIDREFCGNLPNESPESFEKVVTEPRVAGVLAADLRNIHNMS